MVQLLVECTDNAQSCSHGIPQREQHGFLAEALHQLRRRPCNYSVQYLLISSQVIRYNSFTICHLMSLNVFYGVNSKYADPIGTVHS